MAKSARDLADRHLDGTYPLELRKIGTLAARAWETYAEADDIEQEARSRGESYWPELREIATRTYAAWRKIESVCLPIVEAWERERDAREAAENAEEYPATDKLIADSQWADHFGARLRAEAAIREAFDTD